MLGNNIKRIMKEKNIQAKDLAEKIGITPAYLSLILNNKRQNPSYDILNKISETLEVPLFRITEDLFSGNLISKELIDIINNTASEDVIYEISPSFSQNAINIPIVEFIKPNKPLLNLDNIKGYYPTPEDYLDSEKEYFYLRVKGDSMNINFQDGSLILIEKCNVIESGDIGVVFIKDIDIEVKKVIKNQNMITLIPMSTNPIHIPKMYDVIKDEIEIVGKVKMSINFL